MNSVRWWGKKKNVGHAYKRERERDSDCKASFTPAKMNGLQNAPDYFEGQTDLQVWCSFLPLRHITFDKKPQGVKLDEFFV